MKKTTILVVDDEESVGRSLGRVLQRQGFTVELTQSVAEAWACLERREYDLVLVDNNMPRESGMVLLKRLQASDHKAAAVLITGNASVETIDEALRLGAEDYITKPFDDLSHLARRLQSVLDRRISSLLFDVMLSDLKKAVLSGTQSSSEFTNLSQTLLNLKTSLGKHPACVVIDSDPKRGALRCNALYDANIVTISLTPEDSVSHFLSKTPAMTAAISLECENSLESIRALHDQHPHLILLAITNSCSSQKALQAVDAGASDFILLKDEGMAGSSRRIQRFVAQARRHRLYLEIVAMLYRAVKQVRPDLADDLIYATPEGDRIHLVS